MAEKKDPAENKGEEREEGEITPAKNGPDSGGKHPLEHHWTLWFDNPNGRHKQSTWGNSLRGVYTFGTVEDFWCLFNNVVQPSRLISGADFHVFKKGIEPKWEDPKCAGGGKWTLTIKKNAKGATGAPLLDTYWLHTLLAMIGEQYEDGDDICGAVVQVRGKEDRISIWTKTASNEELQVRLAKQWKDLLDATESRLGYLVHADAKEMERKARDRYTV